ncbi:MBL fold metallo-hydrolase [Pelagibius litoralis]|uniref:MBL fold metallo-hydrolase n=1 Tax=Pelagibius litoralis TaxID=374515 RepID=A0A967F1H0_9PROT|nr:MBL fold metallo-hydrolase [Pelagibius litoralis]NIA71418.1 MBL fold metallo-hydrolase [Pelagibius litoralis]
MTRRSIQLLAWGGGLLLLFATPALALEVQPVAEGVYALVGEKEQRSSENLANNATFGVVVTDEGVVLVDPGGSRRGAEEIDRVILGLTDQPVKVVINTGGQDHRWLGNGYWRAKGARVIASAAAVADQRERASMQMTVLRELLGAALEGTEQAFADEVFEDTYAFTLGGERFELKHAGPAHTPGDSYVWLPGRRVVFTGDIVYVERLLGVGPQSSSRLWLQAFEAVAALDPLHVVPGHGHLATLGQARAETYDYLVNLRDRMRAYIDAGGDMIGSVEVDQSAFAHLEQFDALAGRNAQQVFSEMEWE